MADVHDVRDLNPTCEDYNSDDSDDHVVDFAGRSPGTAAAGANVSARRSHPSDLGADKPGPEKVINIDVQSDSGYSSYTAATMGSADSGPSDKASQSPPAAASAAPIPPPSPATRRKPTIVTEDRKNSSQNSPRKPLQRTGSVTSKRQPGSRKLPSSDECRDPNCTKCGSNAPSARGRRPQSIALDRPLDISQIPHDVRSQRSDPVHSYTTPPSPIHARQPAPYMRGQSIVQPAQTRPRASSSTRRPMSYHGDPGQGYYVPGIPGYPSPPHETGPPPSMSAYHNIPSTMHQNMHNPHMSQFMLGGTPPQHPFYQPGHPMSQTSPPYEHQRPPLSARGSSGSTSNYQTRGPALGFGPPLVTQDRVDPPMPSARYHNAPQSARQEYFPRSRDESESSEYESSSEEEQQPSRSDRMLMPPPKSKKSRDGRPGLRHANTTQVYNERRMSMSQSQTLPERPKMKDPRASQLSATPSRTPSVSRRPALIQHTQSAYDTQQRPAKVMVENSTKSRRRQSLQAYEKSYERDYETEQKRRNRDSKIYRDDRNEGILIPERRSRAGADRRDQYVVEEKQRRKVQNAEAYQQQTRGSYEPMNERVHEAALRRASRAASGHSETGSSRSDERKSRVSQSARTNMTGGGGNSEIRLRVDASAPLSLSFNGDMEGRTLQINPAEGGMADIVIGSGRGNENTYRSEKGSVTGSRKSLIAGNARREAEEASVRSGRSSQGRRDGDRERRVLRRRRDTEYN